MCLCLLCSIALLDDDDVNVLESGASIFLRLFNLAQKPFLIRYGYNEKANEIKKAFFLSFVTRANRRRVLSLFTAR